jgi:C1A family cysteine protease
MRLLALVFALVSAVSGATLKGTNQQDLQKFQSFMSKFGKKYDSMQELQSRFKVFQSNLELADRRNVENVAAGGDECHGVTQFSDITQEEFQTTYLMKPGFYKPRVHNPEDEVVPQAAASSVDWRKTAGVVTPVKNQAQCGSCWAFSATEAIESFTALAHLYYKNTTVPLSATQSCSCTYVYDGCDGGNPQDVYVKAIDVNGGSESEADLPYVNFGPARSECSTCEVKASVQKYADVSPKDYTNAARGSLQTVLEQTGPPSVCVAAESWNTYSGGVMTTCPGTIDHCVQAVGYEIPSSGKSYWLVRNSWGATWGNAGYIYLDMSGDTCMIQNDINYPKAIAVPTL